MAEPGEALARVQEHAAIAERGERFGKRGAIVVAVLAATLALATLAGNAAATEAILSQEKASDAWNEFQANSLKRHVNEDDAALLRLLSVGTPREKEAVARADELERAVREKYRPNQDAQLERARGLEAERDRAEARHRGLQLSEAAFQLAIVLGSVSIMARSRAVLLGAVLLGAVGALIGVGAILALVAG
jgi:hypothetical protein